MIQASVNCLLLFMQPIACAFCLALVSAGSSIAARMAIIAMTTSNSMRVKPRWREAAFRGWVWGFIGFAYRLGKLIIFHRIKKQAPVLAGACCNCSLTSIAHQLTVIGELVFDIMLVFEVSVAVTVGLPGVVLN